MCGHSFSVLLPSQRVEQGTEPLLYAATSADAVNRGYYGPSRWFGLVGPSLSRVPVSISRSSAC